MKKLLWTISALTALALLHGCVKNPSAIDQLSTNDPVNKMRMPEKPKSPKGSKSFGQPPAEKKVRAAPKEIVPTPYQRKEEIDLGILKDLKEPTIQKFVTVSGDKVPLRKGPGTRFQKIGLAQKGDVFKLLRETQISKEAPLWYLVQDEAKNKFFIPSLFAEVEEREITPEEMESETEDGKERVREAKKVQASKVTSVLDPTPPLPPELIKAKHITLNFEGTEVYDVITTFAELLKLDYVIEGPVEGKITLQTFNKIPAEDLYSVFEQILAISNVTVVKSGNFYRFLPLQDASRKPISLHYGEDKQIADSDRMIIQVIPLHHVTPAAMQKVLTPLLSVNAKLLDVPDTRNLMLIELASNVKKVMKVVQALDIDKLAASDIQLYEMKHSDASVVSEELTEIFTSMGYGKAIGESLTFLPIGRLNSILVVNSLDDSLETVEFWMEKLDQPVSGGSLSTFVYYVQNAEADGLAGILNSIFADSKKDDKKKKNGQAKKTNTAAAKTSKTGVGTNPRTGAPTPAPFRIQGGIAADVEGELVIIPDQDTNSLVIRTAAKNYPGVLELIKKLDLLPQQVLIEVLILDLTIDDQTRTGLEWAMQGDDDRMRNVAGGIDGSTDNLIGSSLGTATSIFAPGGSFFIQNPDKFVAVLQAFASDSKVNVVANPILMTSDNKEATISITDDIPIQSSTLTTNTTQPVTNTTVEFRSVGVKLGILPKINSDNFVNLKINQEISNQGPTVGTTPSFSTRLVNTEVVLKDNQVLVMGGLMRTTNTETKEGLPLLKDIPWLGRLFGSVENTTNKTELMLFITPHIVSNTSDSKFVTDQMKNRLTDLKEAVSLSDS